MSHTHWDIEEKEGGIKILWINRKDMDSHVLSEPVLKELDSIIDQTTDSCKGIIFASKHKNQFIAGADISEIETLNTFELAKNGSESLQEIFNKIESLPFPTVAAIHGACLGGGLELSLSCTWRVASDDNQTAIGLPEIQLGLIPGAGGTQRLPRLVGLQTGLDMVLTGKRLRALKAKKIGLVDEVVHKNLLIDTAMKFAQKPKRTPISKTLAQSALEDNPVGRSIMQKKATEMVDKSTKGFYPAAYRALDVVFKGYEISLKEGLKLEAQKFAELAMTRQCRSLIHLFHATTAIKKHDFKKAGEEKFGNSKTNLVGVIGSGFMGAGIATVCADKELRVRVSDPNPDMLGKAYKGYRDFFKKRAKRKRIKPFEVDQRISLISADTEPTGMNNCDVVIEAVFENLELKQKLLNQTEKNAKDGWIFASNTSAIPISKIAEATSKPENVVGMHFFSPVEKMPLLEVVKTDKSADWAVSRVVDLGQKMGKQVIIVNDGPGFYTTRALAFFLNEAALMLSEGAKIDAIDKALTDFGFPVGPITLIDEVGIDVGFHVLETMASAFSDRIEVPPTLKTILDSGCLGRKNQKGFYIYKEGKKQGVDPEVYKYFSEPKSKPNGIPGDEIVDRCLLVFVNESLKCLDEGVLFNPYDGDVGAVFGLGFPPFWGGPFRYVDHMGAKVISNRLKELQSSYGSRFSPAKILLEHAETGKRFFENELNIE